MKRVLIACEYSGAVRDEFLKLGFDAHSCDLLPCESKYDSNPDRHHQGDILEVLNQDWDLMIAHPPCTHLAVCGARWFTQGRKPWSLQIESLEFVRKLLDADIKHIALENPVSVISTKIRKPDQIIQPFHYGDSVKKTTCLWLKDLPDLIPTDIVEPEIVTMKGGKKMSKFHYETFKLPPKERGHARSKTFEGIAKAMAKQWGDYITQNNGEEK
jgi:site-specific DNA-cytosine methylase